MGSFWSIRWVCIWLKLIFKLKINIMKINVWWVLAIVGLVVTITWVSSHFYYKGKNDEVTTTGNTGTGTTNND